MAILGENGQPINQIKPTEPTQVSPLLAAYFKVAYERDPQFKALIEDFKANVKRALVEAGIDADPRPNRQRRRGSVA